MRRSEAETERDVERFLHAQEVRAWERDEREEQEVREFMRRARAKREGEG